MGERKPESGQVPAEVLETVREILSAIRAVRLYPPNNPLYIQTISRSYKAIEKYLAGNQHLNIAIQKTGFFYEDTPLERGHTYSRSIAHDIFMKGIRQVSFLPGLTESELRDFYTIISMPAEELRLKGSAASILWEKGVVHIKLREAELDSVVISDSDPGSYNRHALQKVDDMDMAWLRDILKGSEMHIFGKRLNLSEILYDPKRFGADALEIAISSVRPGSTIESVLFEIYQNAGRKIGELGPKAASPLFEALAESILSLDPKHRDRLVSSYLYPELDSINLAESIKKPTLRPGTSFMKFFRQDSEGHGPDPRSQGS